MYTATLKSKEVDLVARRLNIVVTINDGTRDREQAFQFSLNTTIDKVKKTIQSYIDELEAGEKLATELTEGVSMQYTPPVGEEPTADDLAKQSWQADRAKLSTVMELVRDGVFDGTEAQVTALQVKVKTNLKAEYLN